MAQFNAFGIIQRSFVVYLGQKLVYLGKSQFIELFCDNGFHMSNRFAIYFERFNVESKGRLKEYSIRFISKKQGIYSK